MSVPKCANTGELRHSRHPSRQLPSHRPSSKHPPLSHHQADLREHLILFSTAYRFITMKGGSILAAAGLAGLAHGSVHTLKLQKIPLSEQLEQADITTQANSLYKKYAGQKFMGLRPDSHKDEMFKYTSIHSDQDDHPVPVSNFLNAQCTYVLLCL